MSTFVVVYCYANGDHETMEHQTREQAGSAVREAMVCINKGQMIALNYSEEDGHVSISYMNPAYVSSIHIVEKIG